MRVYGVGVFLSALILTPNVAACPTKQHVIDCFYDKADSNRDGRITVRELTNSINKYVPWYEQWIFTAFGGIRRILSDCDANGDRILTKEEGFTMEDTCLESCYKRTHTASIFGCPK